MKRKTKTGKLKILGRQKLQYAHLLMATGSTDLEICKRLNLTAGALKTARARPGFDKRAQETRAILEHFGAKALVELETDSEKYLAKLKANDGK